MANRILPTKAERIIRADMRKRAVAVLPELTRVIDTLSKIDPRAFSTRALDKPLEP